MDSRMVVGMNIHREICALQMNGGVVILPEQVHAAFCIGLSRLEVPEQTLGGIPLGLGMVMKINFLNFHVCAHIKYYTYTQNLIYF